MSDSIQREPGFVSLRWRILLPVFVLLLVLGMVLAYFVTRGVAGRGQDAQMNQLLLASESAAAGLNAVFNTHVEEATRLAYTEGLVDSLLANEQQAMRNILVPGAAAAGLDGVILLDAAGNVVFGVQRVEADGQVDYSQAIEGTFSASVADAVLQEGRSAASRIARASGGFVLATGVPVIDADAAAGVMVVFTRLSEVLAAVRSSGLSQAVFYGGDGEMLATFSGVPQISPEIIAQVVSGEVPVAALTINEIPYQAAYQPFAPGGELLGVLGVFLPNNVPYATSTSRQLLSLLTAALTAAVLIGLYVTLNRVVVGRVQRITAAAQALAQGDSTARAQMAATDEIGELGHSLDLYADRVAQRQESLRTLLRRQRRENARLIAIVQSIPNGIVVQDLDSRVILMNDAAREMLGSQRAFRSSKFSELTAVVNDVLGAAIAPGIYALGQPQRIPHEGRMLSAQAAAITTVSGRRVGTVLVLQDITEQVWQEQARESLLERLSQDAGEPLKQIVQFRPAIEALVPMRQFAREIARNVAQLQRVIAEVRDLTDLNPDQLAVLQRPVPVDSLLEALIAEWLPAAEAASLDLQLMIADHDLYVLADERRLRWALGSLLDNAIKFTLSGGTVRLFVRRDKSGQRAELLVQDTGVGVTPGDLPHLFTRFYRGTPRLPDGTVLHTPGMGQGLYMARRVIEAHGGALRLESKVGRGTAVICILPLTAPVSAALPEHVPARESVPVRRNQV